MACRGVCSRQPDACRGGSVGPGGRRLGPYARGLKGCRECSFFFSYEGRFCPCCGVRLAYKWHETRKARSRRVRGRGL